jgi:hypothetical protein
MQWFGFIYKKIIKAKKIQKNMYVVGRDQRTALKILNSTWYFKW